MIGFLRRKPDVPDRLTVAGRCLPLEIVHNPRARRLALKADASRGIVRLRLPTAASTREGLTFLEDHQAWLARQIERWPVARPFAPGATVPFDGREIRIDWDATRPRTVRMTETHLLVGGPEEGLSGRITRGLRRTALADMAPRATALADRIGRAVRHVRLSDPHSRWASCTHDATLAFSWRLMLAPAWVRDSVVAHEVAHLVHMNHGRAFWQLATELYGSDMAAPRAWLARHGAALHWVGRTA